MRRTIISVLFVALAVGLFSSTTVFADKVYHSERLDFGPTIAGVADGHLKLRKGQVVNIHPNGPVNGAHERYMVIGARSDTTYQVEIQVFIGDESCGGVAFPQLETVMLHTDKHGNARGKATFSMTDLESFSGFTLGVQWHLIADGIVAYTTECTIVSID